MDSARIMSISRLHQKRSKWVKRDDFWHSFKKVSEVTIVYIFDLLWGRYALSSAADSHKYGVKNLNGFSTRFDPPFVIPLG